MMPSKIAFVSAHLCEYAVDDRDGRTTLAGLVSGNVVLAPRNEVPKFLAVFIRPLAKETDFQIHVRAPGLSMKVTTGYGGDSDPEPFDSIIYPIRLHRFGGRPGRYVVSLSEVGGELEDVFAFSVRSPPPEPAEEARSLPSRPPKKAPEGALAAKKSRASSKE
jgi:hypothetical protein